MVDPATYQVLASGFGSIVEEMQSSLFRTGFSTAIRESHDASSALLLPDGRLLGQMAILPTHMGAFPACVAGLLRRYALHEMRPGDVFVMNDPYEGGSAHSPDVAVITPAFHGGELVAFAATMAHKTDLGSINPGGGASQARDIFQEGLLLPPVRWGPEIEAIIRRNSRTPGVVIGDLRGQIGANRVGAERVAGLVHRRGLATVREAAEELFDRTEARVRRAVREWPDGCYRAEGFLDNDGVGREPVRLAMELVIDGDRICFDFSGSDPQTRGPVNINIPLVRACCYYGLVASIDPDLPNNAGLHRMVETRFAPRSVLNPEFPAGVNVYVYTLSLAAELVLAVLGQVAPDRRIACSGSTGGLTLAYEQGGNTLVQYELLGTGGGARRGRDGVNGIQTHIVNCRTAPIEIIETEFPVRVRRFELRTDSGGAGRFRGGLGYVREYEILAESAALSTRGDRHRFPAWGAEGGESGALGRFVVNPGRSDERVIQARTSGVMLKRGDVLLLQTPGGGGFGSPEGRDPEMVRQDVADGYVSREEAVRIYRFTER
jgi:N-methylhydantoinase B